MGSKQAVAYRSGGLPYDLLVGQPGERLQGGWRRRRHLFACLVVLTTAGCTDCSAVGCSDQVSVTVTRVLPADARPFVVKVCADDRCQDTTVPADRLLDGNLVPVQGTVTLTSAGSDRDLPVDVEVRSASVSTALVTFHGTVRLTKNQPNGARCGPTCWQAHLVVP